MLTADEEKIMKTLSYFLRVIGMLCLPFCVTAQELTCGEDCHWEWDATTKTLTVSGSGQMKDYGPNAAVGMDKLIYQAERPWNDIALEVEHIVVDGLSSVGHRAFQNMKNVQEIVLSDSVETVGRSWHDQIKTVYADTNAIPGWGNNGLDVYENNFIPYKKTASGRYILDGIFYNSLSELGCKSSSVKRIYTVEEATAVSGNKNAVMIRYK